MFETECKGCSHGRRCGYFLYCQVSGKPAKRRCYLFDGPRELQVPLEMFG